MHGFLADHWWAGDPRAFRVLGTQYWKPFRRGSLNFRKFLPSRVSTWSCYQFSPVTEGKIWKHDICPFLSLLKNLGYFQCREIPSAYSSQRCSCTPLSASPQARRAGSPHFLPCFALLFFWWMHPRLSSGQVSVRLPRPACMHAAPKALQDFPVPTELSCGPRTQLR